MYLAEVRLQNWRSYQNARFQFKPPGDQKRLTFIGAMNGSGKTSFLTALYLGLFGRHGLQFVEGLQDISDAKHYREAMRQFRHRYVKSDSPVSVEIVLESMTPQGAIENLRLKRVWHYQPNGQLRQGDGSEEVQLYIEGEPVHVSSPDEAHKQLKERVFPVELTPAFLFDGEQAQRMIFEGGSERFQREVAVLFGTAKVDFAAREARNYSYRLTQSAGGARAVDQRQQRLKELKSKREQLEQSVKSIKSERAETESERKRASSDIQERRDELKLLGADGAPVTELHERRKKANQRLERCVTRLDELAEGLNLALAMKRLKNPIDRRLRSEAAREEWLNVKKQTEEQTNRVVEKAAPTPHNNDELLNTLTENQWTQLRERIAEAVQLIYQPPPEGCADEFVFGFIRGEPRKHVSAQLDKAASVGGMALREAADDLTDAERELQDADQLLQRLEGLGPKAEKLREDLEKLEMERDQATKQLGELDNHQKAITAELDQINREIQKLTNEISGSAPDQQRAAVAERAAAALTELSAALRPIAVERLRSAITRHFLDISDERFTGGKIVFEEDRPLLRREGQPDQLIETMSGFERRAFGIAYSLALVEATGQNLPLVIDTPFGNADTLYRDRLLRALADVKLDQVVVLPHNAEVPPEMLHQLNGRVRQTFLVDYDRNAQTSVVHHDTYFGSKI